MDAELRQGVYFENEARRRDAKRAAKMQKQTEADAERKGKRDAVHQPPSEEPVVKKTKKTHEVDVGRLKAKAAKMTKN